ncbi:Fic family protein [archaeon]|jgi:Fic family protein|nr:Fic family protein [archaeon]MBT3578113.1 Fic family protein [archaeon]MBT6820661.1 Fic family protein [archaeon]MBT6955694.1 Fic family protein [archaeon]MBT7024929.1 Fic family protein [archaeon]
MFIEKRKDGKQYLVHSFREGNKVNKVRKFLGKNLSKKELNKREEIAKRLILEEINLYKIIEDPLKVELSKEEIEFIKNLQEKENLKVVHLSKAQWERFSELFTYNTNAIEGSQLTEREVENILEDNVAPKDATKEDVEETYGVNEAIEFIRSTKDHLSIDLIKELHKIVFKKSKSFAGNFRKEGEDVVIMDGNRRIVHHGAPPERVSYLLRKLIQWYAKNKKKYPALILATVVHNQFENIHPFADGNGRVGRLLLNNILIKNKLPPVDISLKNRFEYYETLQEYENKNNLRPSIDLIIKEYKRIKKLSKK